MTDYKQLCSELVEAWDATADFDYNDFGNAVADLVVRARAALAEPEPEEPTDEELRELWMDCWDTSEECGAFQFARAVLARWGNRQGILDSSASKPIPVSERVRQVEDLAADAVGALRYIEQVYGRLYGVGWDRVYEKADHLRPDHALPLPREVE